MRTTSLPPGATPDLRAWAAAVQKPSAYRSVAADTNATFADGLIDVAATAGNRTVTLPDPAEQPGGELVIAKVDASANTVKAAGTVNGSAGGYTLTMQYETVTLKSTGTEWRVL